MPSKTKSVAPKAAKSPPKPTKAASREPTPLDVMLDVMRKHHDAGELAEALAAAKAAAPHFYAQLKNAESQDAIDPESMSDDELERRIKELLATLESVGDLPGYRVVRDRTETPEKS